MDALSEIKISDMFRKVDFQKSVALKREAVCRAATHGLVAHGDTYRCFKESAVELRVS